MKLQSDNSEDELVTSRILFFSTYGTNLDFEALVKNHSLADNVNYVCAIHIMGYQLTDKHSNLVDTPSNFPNQDDGLCHRWMKWA